MHIRTVALIIGSVAGLSACTESMEITQAPVDVTRNSSFVTQNYVGDDQSVVRSYFAEDEEKGTEKTEFAGAQCQIKGRGFSAKFTTPVILNLPDYDYYTAAATGQCAVNGVARPLVLKPYNETVRARTEAASNAGASGGLIGILAAGIVSGVVEAANDPSDDDWDYPNASVMFPATAAGSNS